MRNIFLYLCIAFVGVHATAAPRQTTEVVSGRIIAYSLTLACLNGNSYWSMVIRVEPYKKLPARFVRVNFSLPCDKTAESVLINPSTQKFHLIRQNSLDSVLEEFIVLKIEIIDDLQKINEGIESNEISKIPVWHYLPGNERFSLPFREVLPCYYSVEYPSLPLL